MERVKHAYHHGNLASAVLERAAEVIAMEGPHNFSLRSLAADLGVSHTAPRHHFGSREGVLNALAVQGYDWLADRLRRAREDGGSFLDVGVAYVEFALAHPAHFQVMFAPALLDQSDPGLQAARQRAFRELSGGVERLGGHRRPDEAAAIVAAWSLVHGLATLALNGNFDNVAVRALLADTDLPTLARRSASLLFRAPPD